MEASTVLAQTHKPRDTVVTPQNVNFQTVDVLVRTSQVGYLRAKLQCSLSSLRKLHLHWSVKISHQLFASDDAVQSYTINAVNNLLAHRKNPNGCTPKMTYYTQISYTNFTLVTDWFVAGNEIADHT